MASMERGAATAPVRIPETNSDIESLPSLFGRLGDDVMTLVDTKLSLLKVEIKEDADAYIRGGTSISAGLLVAAVGFALVNMAVAFLVSRLFSFSEPINYALGFVITGVAYLIIGGIVVMVAKNNLAKRNLVPTRSVAELRKDKQWLKNEI